MTKPLKETGIPFRFLAAPVTFAFIFIFFFALDLYLTAKEKKIRSEWGSHPVRGQVTNGTAERLSGMAIKLGIVLEAEKIYLKQPDFELQSKKLEKIWNELSHHVRAEAVAAGSPDPIPDETKRFLSESQSDILQIKKHLVYEASPVWREENPSEADFFSTLKGILRLHHVFAADALFQLTAKNALESEESLTACWKLNESLRNRKEPISVFVALKCSTIQMGLVRKLPSISEIWHNRFRTLEYRKSVSIAVTAESARFFESLNEKSVRRDLLMDELSPLPEWGKAPAAMLLDPYLRICRLNYITSERELVLALQSSKNPAEAPKRENPLLSDFLHEYESMNSTLLEFEKKQKKFLGL
ncbi:hypothetical protein L0222_12915 [bacterium]|nr:hypothetical protein [bacterium]MCI0605713.1 hypothetical protein [bacterium]